MATKENDSLKFGIQVSRLSSGQRQRMIVLIFENKSCGVRYAYTQSAMR